MVPRAVGFTIVWPEGVIFGSIMTYHVQFLLLVRQPLFDRGSPAAHTDLMGASTIKCWQNDTKTLQCIKLQPWVFQKGRVLAQDGIGSSSASSVIMMETTHLWNGTDFAHRRRLYAARLGRVLLKRQMSPARMIVVDVFA